MKSIYLDHQATTPVDRRVLESMMPFFSETFANPHANTYALALNASRAVEHARRQIANSIKASANDIVFSSGATESNNLSILGTALASKNRRGVVTQATEHISVLRPIEILGTRGFHTTVVGVNRDGIVDIEQLRQAVDDSTLLVSVMLINNETGVIQPIKKVAQICRERGAILHCDCAQSLGKLDVDIEKLGVDLASFSAHKAYGPKGIGVLYVKNLEKARISPICFGGGQEAGLRPGTLPVPLCVGFGTAASIAASEQDSMQARNLLMENKLWSAIKSIVPQARINGHESERVAGCLNISFPRCNSDSLIDAFAGLSLSTGSACEANKTKVSHVLKAMRVPRADAIATIRMSIGRFTTESDIDAISSIVKRTFST